MCLGLWLEPWILDLVLGMSQQMLACVCTQLSKLSSFIKSLPHVLGSNSKMFVWILKYYSILHHIWQWIQLSGTKMYSVSLIYVLIGIFCAKWEQPCAIYYSIIVSSRIYLILLLGSFFFNCYAQFSLEILAELGVHFRTRRRFTPLETCPLMQPISSLRKTEGF